MLLSHFSAIDNGLINTLNDNGYIVGGYADRVTAKEQLSLARQLSQNLYYAKQTRNFLIVSEARRLKNVDVHDTRGDPGLQSKPYNCGVSFVQSYP